MWLCGGDKYGVVVLVMVMVAVCCGDTVTTSSHECDVTTRRLIQIKVLTPEVLNPVPSNGTALCSGGQCCSQSLSEPLQQHGLHVIHRGLQRTAKHLRGTLHARALAIKGAVVDALSVSEQQTLQVFDTSYPRLVEQVKPVLHTFYTSLRDALDHTDSTSLEAIFTKFWDDLFPVVYHGAVHAKMPPFTQSYSDCIRESRRTIRPWGIVPTLVDQSVTRAIESTRLLLHALHVGSRILQFPETYRLPEECATVAARMTTCGLCHAVSVPPCQTLCLNVARGCLAPLAEIGASWTDLVNGVARAGKALNAAKSFFERLSDHLPESVLIAMETGPKLQKKVRRQCGPPTHEVDLKTAIAETANSNGTEGQTTATNPHNNTRSAVEGHHDKEGTTLPSPGHLQTWPSDALVKLLVREMYNTRDWWQELPGEVCQNISTTQEPCWNGEKLGTYTRELAGIGVSAQKYNAEVKITSTDNSVYGKADTLRTVKRLIMSRITWLPESDSQKREDYAEYSGGVHVNRNGGGYMAGSGERNYESYDVDDEDAYTGEDGSGYGSGDGMPEHRETENYPEHGHNEGSHRSPHHKDRHNSGSSAVTVGVVVLLASALISQRANLFGVQ